MEEKIKQNRTMSVKDLLAFEYNKYDRVDLTGSLKREIEKIVLIYKNAPDYYIVYRPTDKKVYYIELNYDEGGYDEETGEDFIVFYSNRITIPEEGLKLSSAGELV